MTRRRSGQSRGVAGERDSGRWWRYGAARASNGVLAVRLTVPILAAVLAASCASSADLLNREPDFVLDLPADADLRAIAECVEAGLVAEGHGAGIQDVHRPGETLLIQHLEGFAGPQGTVWVARFVPGRATVAGMGTIRGPHGWYVPPVIERCAGSPSIAHASASDHP